MADYCGICDEPIEDQPWVLLNRIAYGTGHCRGFSEYRDEECYLWEVDWDDSDQDEIVSGIVLCFPDCLQLYIEGKMVEADIAKGHTE